MYIGTRRRFVFNSLLVHGFSSNKTESDRIAIVSHIINSNLILDGKSTSVYKYRKKYEINILEKIITEKKDKIKSNKHTHQLLNYSKNIIECPLTYTYELLEKLNVDKVIHAHEPSEDVKYHYFCKNIPDKFERYPYTKEISTTDIIDRVIRKNT